MIWANTSGFSDYVGLSINTKGSTEYTIDTDGGRYLDVNEMYKPRSVEVVDTPAAKGAVKTQFVRIIQGYKSSEHCEQGEHIMDTEVKEEMTEVVVQESTDESAEQIKGDSQEVQADAVVETTTEETPPVVEEVHVEVETNVVEEQAQVEQPEVVESDETQVTESLANETLLSPLKTYLQGKQIIYQGDNVSEIVESIDLTGLGHLDQAALKELRNLLKNGKLNSAKNLINDMISSMYRLQNALEFLDEYKVLGLIKESTSKDLKKDVEDIQTQEPTSMKVD